MKSRVVEVTMSVSNITEALEHWFNTVIFRDTVQVESVTFQDLNKVFNIKFIDKQEGVKISEVGV